MEHLLGERQLETTSWFELDWECSLDYSGEEDVMRSVKTSLQALALALGCAELWARGMEYLWGDCSLEMT
jgi:hypothetical protein